MAALTGRSLITKKIAALDEKTIYELFGSFDAETEDLNRFKEFFVTNDFYERFVADFPLRIAVGNKGTGKSAIIRKSLIEELDRPDVVCVSLNAADLVARAGDLPADGLKAINHWKMVFAREAASQILTSAVSEKFEGDMTGVMSSLPAFITWVSRLLSKKTSGATDIALKVGLDLNNIKKIAFYLDDLDKDWNGRVERLYFVNSLLNACYDISKKEKNIKFKIGIRWDLWDAVSAINQDIDKIRQNAIFLRWSNHEIYVVVANRIARFFGQEFPVDRFLKPEIDQKEMEQFFDPILDPVFKGHGRWDGTSTRHVVLSMTRNRPRDLLALLTLAAQEANRKKRTRIVDTDLQSIFPTYSEQRLTDLVVEFGTRLSGLKPLLLSFKPAKTSGKAADAFRFTNDRMTKHLQAVLKLHSGKIRFASDKTAPDWRRILDFLYQIDFLSAWYRGTDDSIERVSFQDRQLAVTADADFGYSWEVLMAYRWAIQPSRIQDVIASLH